MCGLESFGDLPTHVERFAQRERVVRHALCERLSGNELHDEEALAFALLQPVQRRNPRMIERGEQARLAIKTSQALRIRGNVAGQQLERNLPPE